MAQDLSKGEHEEIVQVTPSKEEATPAADRASPIKPIKHKLELKETPQVQGSNNEETARQEDAKEVVPTQAKVEAPKEVVEAPKQPIVEAPQKKPEVVIDESQVRNAQIRESKKIKAAEKAKPAMSSRDEYGQPVFSGRVDFNRGEPTEAEIDDELVSASSQEDVDEADLEASPPPKSGRSFEARAVSMINRAWSFNRPGSTNPPELFDDIQCVSLEYNYQSYHKAEVQDKPKHQHVQIDPETVIDIAALKEVKRDGGQGLVVQRQEESEEQPRVRPRTMYQADFSKTQFPRQAGNPDESALVYDFEKFTWLAELWFKRNGGARYPSRNQIIKGVIEADRREVIRQNPAADATQPNMIKLLAQREEAWHLVFEYCDFLIRNMDAPIDAGQLHYLPFHPATRTCLYIMQMETPIRYALNKATMTRDESSVATLGPLAFALKAVVMHSNKERDDVGDGKFVCWVGTQLPEETITDYKGALGEEINLTGYTVATMKEVAVAEAFKIKVPGKVPVLLAISIDCDYNLVKINRPEYTPYHTSENVVVLQDGLCLLVQNVEATEEKVGLSEQSVVKISMQNIASFE